jgi:uncharacterized damage-inducible protein DinB
MNLLKFSKDFQLRALRTVRLVRMFEDKDLAFRPAEGSMSTAELIQHICGSHNFTRGLLIEDTVSVELFKKECDVSTVDAAWKSLSLAIHAVVKAAKNVSPAKWAELVEPFGPEFRMSRGDLAYMVIEHEVHHCGQLHVYLRMTGKVPPMLYEPVDESILAPPPQPEKKD